MFNTKRMLLYAVLLAALLEPASGRRGRGHSNSKWGGLFGGGRNNPPRGSHRYQSSGGSHSYPLSGGLSGDSHRPPQMVGRSHSYPLSGGLSGYSHRPLQMVTYPPVHHGAPMHYPVYQDRPPPYVNKIKKSGSKYGPLLAGLALLNLGTLGAAAYVASGHGKTHYTPQKGEVCKFAIRKENGDYDEMIIDCQIMSSFILKDQALLKASNTTTTVANLKVMPGPDGYNRLYVMQPRGMLVPYIETTTPTTTTRTRDRNAKGAGTNCYVIHITASHKMERNVPCGLLMTYAKQSDSDKLNARNGPTLTIVSDLNAKIFYLIFWYFFHRGH